MKADLKRQNFNITPEQEAEIAWLKEATDSPTTKDAILWAVRVMSTLAREASKGRSVYIIDANGEKTRLMIPELESSAKTGYRYLVERPHRWRRQLYVKGRRLLAFNVWMDMLVNNQTKEQAAEDWDLPMEAVDEIVDYCEQNRALLEMEADEERSRLLAKGVVLEPSHSR